MGTERIKPMELKELSRNRGDWTPTGKHDRKKNKRVPDMTCWKCHKQIQNSSRSKLFGQMVFCGHCGEIQNGMMTVSREKKR